MTNEAASTLVQPNESDSSVSKPGPSQPSRKCIIHSERCSQLEPILPLQEKHWSAITNASKNRSSKAKFHASIYYNIIRDLPQEPNESHGYHVRCYKNFTAVVPNGTEETLPNQERKNIRSQSFGPKATESSTGIFPVVCLFCNTVRRHKKEKFEFLGSCETKEAAESIQNAARLLVDEQILAKIAGVDLIAKEVKYHHSCKSAFLLKADRQRERRNDASMNETENCNARCNSFEIISLYVQNSILSENRPELLTSVYSRYLDFCEESGEEAFSSAQYLLKSLKRKFGEKLNVQSSEAKKTGSILHSSTSSVEAMRQAFNYASSEEGLLNKAALVLRKKLKSVERKDLWDNPKVESFAEGEASPPNFVENFFAVLYGGPDLDKHSLKVKRAANSSSSSPFTRARSRTLSAFRQPSRLWV